MMQSYQHHLVDDQIYSARTEAFEAPEAALRGAIITRAAATMTPEIFGKPKKSSAN